MRSLRVVIAVTLVLALASAATLSAAATSSAAPRPHVSKRCGVVTKGSREYRAKARAVSCRFGRKWARAYLRSGRKPRGWKCTRTSGKAPFYCTRGRVKAYWVERL